MLASEKHNETAKMAVEENEKSQTNETGNNVQGGGISIVNNTQTNSNNVNNTFNNINNNNFYIFGNQLEEIMSHFPASPPHLDLPPPPLPPLMFGCENEDYEWRLVSKVYTSVWHSLSSKSVITFIYFLIPRTSLGMNFH